MNLSTILKISTGVLAGATAISAAADVFFNGSFDEPEVLDVNDAIDDADFIEI